LQRNIKRIRAETLEAINQRLLRYACRNKIERGRKVRIDCTVTETNIHHPTDSSLLWDCVRVLAKLVLRGRDLVSLPATDHRRRAKRRAIGIMNAKSEKARVPLYRDLLKVSRKTVGMAERMASALAGNELARQTAADLLVDLRHYLRLARQVISQAERRVLQGEQVPREDKIVSIFEAHTDIIVKDRREPLYGHKLCLATGVSGLVLDCVVQDGNPADSSLAQEMVHRQDRLYGRVPRQTAYDGGFASRDNLHDIKALGVKDVVFAKKRGLQVSDMAKSSWVYKRLRDWRAGIEGMISFFKRCFGLDRCLWRGVTSFRSYVWSSVVSANLLLMARHILQ
jgi:IS5 family transposase